MTLRFVATRPSALIPIAMSLIALADLALALVLGVTRQPDEGIAARVWQLMIAGQLPIVAFFAISWVPRAPKQALLVMAIQLCAALLSIIPVFALDL